MDLSKLKVLVVDDSMIKADGIKRALNENHIRDIVTVSDQEKAWEVIEGEEQIDLIVSDMQYPLTTGGVPDDDAGLKLIKSMKNKGINIPVIICSSIKCNEPGVISVWYDEYGRNDIRAEFQSVLEFLQERVR